MTDDVVNEHLSELGSGCAGRDEYRRRLSGVMWFEVRAGLISRHTVLWDSSTFPRQTGQAE